MEPGQLLFFLLSQAAPVVALVATRIYPVRVPQGTARPYLTYQVVSDVPDGPPECRPVLSRARVQVSVFADTYEMLCAISADVRTTLNGYRAGETLIDYDGYREQADDGAICLLRTQDFFVEYLLS